jgi:hypothetical protein
MGLSRLDNFLKSARGTILYVDPSSLDSTDSIENSGNSLTRPFKTIQRALIEAARFSYQRGLNNDRFNKTTILLYPGDHIVDNRPGYIPTGTGIYSSRGGQTNLVDITQWSLETIFDLSTPDNVLYKLNSVYGGVIVPRGTSIVGMDLRKTKIRPTYVPNPQNSQIERSCIFRTTGACYFWQFTILDADPNGTCYKDYTANTFVPNFSHHKLSGFEYADGVNGVYINDDFLNGASAIDTTRTDLDMYYEKVAAVYGTSSGREIQPDYNEGTVDIQPVIDEYRIVGPKGASVGITSIRAGDGGLNPSTTITVDLVETIEGLSVDSPIQISGVSATGYDGQYVISTVNSSTQITYTVQNEPTNPLPGVVGSTLSLVVDTVTSASPYIFNISLRSVYGMCGLLADGDKATGFKSMVVAQYTGIGLQKDDNAFVKYDTSLGEYRGRLTYQNLHTDSRARFIPEYENFHIKATNDSFLQLVSVFAIGYAQHFVAENGGDLAINNSNSNFGAKSLISTGFRRESFPQDDGGYITHIIPPKEIDPEEVSVEFTAIDVGITTQVSAGSATTSRLYLYNETNQDAPPKIIIDGYHIGAKLNEKLSIQTVQSGILSTYSSDLVMPDGPYRSTQSSSEKIFVVGKNVSGINSISGNVLTLNETHSLIDGESIRVISENGNLPDGLQPNQIYYASSVGLSTSNQIYISKTLSDALSNPPIAIGINNKGGSLKIVSRVSDKNPGDIGHPIQWDTAGYWYANVSATNNRIYDAIKSFGVAGLGNATTRSYVTRKPDPRSLIDTLYRVRYVIPKESTLARPPVDGFVLQESNNIVGSGAAEISQLYNPSASISSINLRNPKFIADASYSSGTVTIRSETPHDLKVGDQVEVVNVSPSGYNGTYTVTLTPSAKEFTYAVTTSLGSFANNTSVRDEDLPYFRRKKYTKTYQIYRAQEIQPFIPSAQDGVYYLTLINHSNKPTVAPFSQEGFSQPVENLYPQANTDNPNSDPVAAVSHALPDQIGKVVVNDSQRSITKETLESFIIGYGITDIQSSSGTAHTIYTAVDHGLSKVTSVSIVSGGSNYGSGSPATLYNAQLVGFAGSTTGSNATAKLTIGAGGTISGVTIIDGGSAYGIGNTLRVVGVASTAGFVAGVIRVETTSDNVGDILKISGVSSAPNSGYNTTYRVSEIKVGSPKEINVISAETISGFSTTGLGSTVTASSGYLFSGKVLSVSSLTYNSVTGLATVGFTTSHGFKVDNKIQIRGANQSAFNGDFIVKKLNSSIGISSIVVNIGVGATTSTSATGTLYAYRPTLTSYGGNLTNDTESTSGRLEYQYAGITTTLSNTIFPPTNLSTNDSNFLIIPNAVSLGFKLGDYLIINNEIFRIRKNVSSNSVNVHRALLGSPRQEHVAGSVIRKIKVIPVELRRNSIIRASGHTFEYLGFGPGNYSTSLPDKQDRSLSNTEKLLAQATKSDGGIVVYTGMDSEGNFYAGNKKINSATGTEETFDTPIPSNTNEKNTSEVVNITDTQKLFVDSSIKVDGGRDKNVISEFSGPVVFNNKVTSNDDIEANSLLLQGEEEISRKISISNIKPTTVGNYGDVEFNSTPRNGGNAGWIYTTDNEWKPFGWINSGVDLFGVGISTNNGPVGFSTLLNIVGVGLTITKDYDPTTGITTVFFEGDPVNTIGLSSEGTFIGNANAINLVGSDDGFGFDIRIDYDSNVGLATITFDAPVDIIDFKVSGDGNLGYASPSFATTSVGTRVIYENAIGLSTNAHTNYAVGIGADDSLWWSIPQNNSYAFKWYGGETEIARLASNGSLTIFDNSSVTAGRFISTVTTGTSPISVASTTLVSNLNANYLDGFVSSATTAPDTIVRRDEFNNINGNATHLIHNVSGAQRGEWYADIPARLGYFPFNRAGDTCSGDANFNGLTTIKKVSDIYVNRTGSTLTCDFNDGPITRTTSTNVSIINITNVPTTDSRALNYTVVMNAATTVSELASIQFQINGTPITSSGSNRLRWLNNIPPNGTSAGYYFFGFSIFRVGSNWEVIAVFATYT